MSQTRERYFEWTLLGLILLLGSLLFYEGLPFLNGTLGAITLYILLRRVNIALARRFSPRKAAWAITIGVGIFVVIPLVVVMWYVVDLVQSLNFDVHAVINGYIDFIDRLEKFSHFDLVSEKATEFVTNTVTNIMNMFMSGLNNTAINIFAAVLILFFLLLGGMRMELAIARCLPFNDQNKRTVINKVSTIVTSNAIGIPLLALLQGVIAAVGYMLCGVKNPIEFGALTGLASMVPVVGTILVWAPLAIVQALDHHYLSAIAIAAYGACIISSSDNLLRIVMQRRMSNTHPLITLFGVIAGLPLFGFMGIIFGPLMVAMFLLFLEMFIKQYILGSDTHPEPEPQGTKTNAAVPNNGKANAQKAPAAKANQPALANKTKQPAQAQQQQQKQQLQQPAKAKDKAKQQVQAKAKTQTQQQHAKAQAQQQAKAKGKVKADKSDKQKHKQKDDSAKATAAHATPKFTAADFVVRSSDGQVTIAKNLHEAQSADTKAGSTKANATTPAVAPVATVATAATPAAPQAKAEATNSAAPAEQAQEKAATAVAVAETSAKPKVQAQQAHDQAQTQAQHQAAQSAQPKAKAKVDFKTAKADAKQQKREAAKLRAIAEHDADERELARKTLGYPQDTPKPEFDLSLTSSAAAATKTGSKIGQSFVSRAIEQAFNSFDKFDDLDTHGHGPIASLSPEILENTDMAEMRHSRARPNNNSKGESTNTTANKGANQNQRQKHKAADPHVKAPRPPRRERSHQQKQGGEHKQDVVTAKLRNGTNSNGSGNNAKLQNKQQQPKQQRPQQQKQKQTKQAKQGSKQNQQKAMQNQKSRANASATKPKSKRIPSNLDYQVMRPERRSRFVDDGPIIQTVISHNYGTERTPQRSHLRTQLVSMHTAKGTVVAATPRRRPSARRPYH